jgi:hypothetical protein
MKENLTKINIKLREKKLRTKKKLRKLKAK